MGGYIGATAVGLVTTAADVQGDITSTDTTPEVILKNTTETDADGSRDGKITFKGEQSGGEESTLAQIQSSHDGTADDEKGDLIFKTNDGNDALAPTERLRINSAGDVLVSSPDPSLTITNTTHEDTDGGRESTIVFKGEQSGGELSTLAEIEASHDGTADDEKGDLIFKTNDGSDGASPTEAMRIESDQQVLITTSADAKGLTIKNSGNNRPYLNMDANRSGAGNNLAQMNFKWDGTDVARIIAVAGADTTNKDDAHITFGTASAGSVNEAMRIDSSGNLLVGKTVTTSNTAGGRLSNIGHAEFIRSGGQCLYLNRQSSDGTIASFAKDGTTIAEIKNSGSAGMLILNKNSTSGVGIFGSTNSGGSLLPTNHTTAEDNTKDLGRSDVRWDDIYATNGTIQTSDENEKQNIASLTSAEITAATAISKLFKTFKWKDKVAAKGDNARTHSGVVAQQVQSAMSDAGLDAGNYAFFISTTWWETQTEVAAVEADEENNIEAKDAYTRTDSYETADEAPEGATERTRLGVRYPELLSFIGAATEQRLTSIESRLTALEG